MRWELNDAIDGAHAGKVDDASTKRMAVTRMPQAN